MAKKKKVAVKKAVKAHATRSGAGGGAMVGAGAGAGVRGRADDGPLPCPIATDPAMGDKTPAVMAWYREHEPEEYARRYGNRIHPSVGEVVGERRGREDERGPVSDFEEEDEVVVVKPRVIMG